MLKSLVVLALLGTMSVPAAAQPAQDTPAANQTQAKPQMVKKRVCQEDDNAFSKLKTKTCKTVMVPAEPSGASNQQQQQQSSAPAPQ
jgi:hypothetical protein